MTISGHVYDILEGTVTKDRSVIVYNVWDIRDERMDYFSEILGRIRFIRAIGMFEAMDREFKPLDTVDSLERAGRLIIYIAQQERRVSA